jgi:hypothetical protein
VKSFILTHTWIQTKAIDAEKVSVFSFVDDLVQQEGFTLYHYEKLNKFKATYVNHDYKDYEVRND